jgi:cytochrome d ubiquinol oxidase subunit I
MVFHIIFAVYGIGLPLLMVLAERQWLRSGDTAYLTLARRWAIAGSLLFAIGAVSGTAIAFELGLLWPRFMQFAGPYIGMPFSMEGFAFFLEAIFFALYLYGWDRISRAAGSR